MQTENYLSGVDSPFIWFLVAMVVTVLGIVIAFAVGVAVLLTYGLMIITRGWKRCEDCDKRFCQVEIRHDETLPHRGFFR